MKRVFCISQEAGYDVILSSLRVKPICNLVDYIHCDVENSLTSLLILAVGSTNSQSTIF